MIVEIFRSRKEKKEFYVRLKADNGQILMHSEGYSRHTTAYTLAMKIRDSKGKIKLKDLTK